MARRSYGRLVASLAARMRDLAGAEDAFSDAFAAALVDWPAKGVPANPEGWLVATARRRMIDAGRRRARGESLAWEMQRVAGELESMAAAPEPVPDERLRLMFVCAHPAIDAAVRAPLILQTVLGWDAATIASAFLVAPATMGQRLVRAKAKIRLAGIPFRVPERSELAPRLQAVLDAIYAVFAEGWSDPAGAGGRGGNLAAEGIFLGRLVVALLPGEPEALGLLALMLHAEARRRARRDASGDYVPLTLQDVARWDAGLIEEAEALLQRAGTMGAPGRYQLEAAVQSAHAVRRRTGGSDWVAVARLYGALSALTNSPVVTINRAVALAELQGAAAGLRLLDTLEGDARLAQYQPYWAARADLLHRTGAVAAAAEAYQRAIGLESDAAVRRFLKRRCDMLPDRPDLSGDGGPA